MKQLLLRNEFHRIDQQYLNENRTKKDFGLTVLKLLLRCKKMMEARLTVKKIISMIIVRG